MAASFSLPTVLANLTAGNQPLSLIDGNLTTLRDPLLSLNTYSNYYTDVGAANAYAITVSAPQVVAQSAGLPVQFLATNANTGASTLQINALAVKNIKNINGSALTAGQIPAAGIVQVMYDGTQYLLLNPAIPTLTPLSNSLTGDVALNNTGTYFDGPSIAQGSAGTWFVSGSVLCADTAGPSIMVVKLWDGTTIIDSRVITNVSAANSKAASLSGFIASPAGNLKISVRDATTTTGKIVFNESGNSKDGTITAIRIA